MIENHCNLDFYLDKNFIKSSSNQTNIRVINPIITMNEKLINENVIITFKNNLNTSIYRFSYTILNSYFKYQKNYIAPKSKIVFQYDTSINYNPILVQYSFLINGKANTMYIFNKDFIINN